MQPDQTGGEDERGRHMSKFDYMAFGYDCSSADMFVANAKKYTAEQTLEKCINEYSYKFEGVRRRPKIDDVKESHCAFRFGVSAERADGCYTFVGEKDRGAFPVYVIVFETLIIENENKIIYENSELLRGDE